MHTSGPSPGALSARLCIHLGFVIALLPCFGCALVFENPATAHSAASASTPGSGPTSPPSLLGIIQSGSCSGGEWPGSGTLTDAACDGSAGIELTNPAVDSSGTFVSGVIDAQRTVSWTSLAWVPEEPYYKELPGGAQAETGYPTGSGLMSGALLYLHMDEAAWTGTAGEVLDSSGHGFNGTSMNGPTTIPSGRLNRAGAFVAASNQLVRVPYSSVLNPAEFTVMAWARLAVNGDVGDNDIYNSLGTAGEGFDIELYQGRFCFFMSPMGGCQAAGPLINDTNWHHFAMTYDGTTVTAYVDGTEQASQAEGPFSPETVYPAVIGAACNATDCDAGAGYVEPFNGELDEVALFGSALLAPQIKSIYELGIGNIDMTGNIVLLHMDEAAWNGTPGEVIDSSGSGNNGVAVHGATTTSSGRFDGAGTLVGASSQFVKIPYNAAISGASLFTLSIWIRFAVPGDNGNEDIFDAINPAGNLGFDLEINSGQACTDFSGGGSCAGPLVNDGAWHHLAMIDDGSSFALYVDGVFAQRMSGTYTPDVGDPISIGAWCTSGGCASTNEVFNGNVDEVAFFDRPLSQAEIVSLYRRGAERLRFQVRSCPDSACASSPFIGPDGTTGTYYSELLNSSLGPPSLSLSDVADNPYFQYKAYFDTDTAAYSPELVSVTVGPTH